MIESVLRVDVLLFLMIGLLGGAHCIGMCGPLVTMYAERMNPRPDGGTSTQTRTDRRSHLSLYEVRQHALFNVGRTISYAAVGALFGALGALLFVTSDELAGVADLIRGSLGIVIGAFIVAVGAKYVLGGAAGIQLPGVGRGVSWLSARIHRYVNSPGIVGLGALHALLPCPMLYPAYLYAFSTGSPVSGAVALGVLGIGTIPAVFLYGTVIESVGVTHRQRLHRLLGVVFVLLGYILFAHGLMALGYHIPHPHLPHYNPFMSH